MVYRTDMYAELMRLCQTVAAAHRSLMRVMLNCHA